MFKFTYKFTNSKSVDLLFFCGMLYVEHDSYYEFYLAGLGYQRLDPFDYDGKSRLRSG